MVRKERSPQRSLGERLTDAEMLPGEIWLGVWPVNQSSATTGAGGGRNVMNMPGVDEQVERLRELGMYDTVRTIQAYGANGQVRPAHRGIVVKYKKNPAQA